MAIPTTSPVDMEDPDGGEGEPGEDGGGGLLVVVVGGGGLLAVGGEGVPGEDGGGGGDAEAPGG